MGDISESPLDELDEVALYKLLGTAWYSQLKIKEGASHELMSRVEIGKREYEVLAPILKEALRQPYFHGIAARVESTLQVAATWKMPAAVVTALVRRQGLDGKETRSI